VIEVSVLEVNVNRRIPAYVIGVPETLIKTSHCTKKQIQEKEGVLAL